MENQDIAKYLEHIAELLEIKNENKFKVRAYYKAAQTVLDLPQNLAILDRQNKLKDIPGVGESISAVIDELIKTGRSSYYDELKKKVPEGLLKLLEVPDVGPKTAELLFRELGIDSIEKLEEAAREHKIMELSGMGEKSEENIVNGIAIVKQKGNRMLLNEASLLAESVINALKKKAPIEKIEAVGSLRRMKETVGDIDILVVSKKSVDVIDKFTTLEQVNKVLAKGDTKASILNSSGVQIDLRVVKSDEFGSAMHYFTGSKNHNIAIRELAIKKGLKVSEYGVFKGEKKISGKEEADIFDALDLDFIEPEMREDRGEIEASLNGKLPKVIDYSDIKGDFHIHSNLSDGTNTLEEIASAAKKLGYEYIAISDHSQSLRIANGLTVERLKKKISDVKKLRDKVKKPYIMCGAEIDIKPDGSLDYPDSLLKELDFVIAAIHSSFKMDEETMTKRIIKGISNKYVNLFAHPQGRLIGKREAYKVNMEELIKAAVKFNVCLEINSNPERLDLSDIYVKRAKEAGIMMTVDTDSHSIEQFPLMRFGVGVARRGWLEKKDVLNTLPLKEMLKRVGEKR